MKTAENYKKPIVIRKIDNSIWQKFKVICKENDPPTANYGVKRLIRNAVKQYEAEHGEVKL